MPFDYIKESGRVKQRCESLSITPTKRLLIVSIHEQELAVIEGDTVQRIFKVSTSKNEPSCVADSYGTPTGLHELGDFIGAGQLEGMVFKGRVPTGRHFSDYSPEEQADNMITTRIIRIRGLEPKVNAGSGCDTYERYVYIHGTNHEERIGEPFSGGCIEMLNAEVVELFRMTTPGDLIAIS